MTRDQFISWLKGFSSAVEKTPNQLQWETIVSELGKIQECTDFGSPIGEGGWGVPNTSPFTPFKPTPNPYIGGKEGKVMYSDICNCNPKNGGNGICGCVIAHELVDPNIKQDTVSTGTIITDIQNSSITRAYPPNTTLTYTIKDDSKDS